MDKNKRGNQSITLASAGSLRKKPTEDSVASVLEAATNEALAEAASGKEKLAVINASLTAALKLDRARKVGLA